MITVYASTHAAEIHLTRHALERAGIVSFIADENMTRVQPMYAYATGGIKLQVAEKNAEQARRILLGMHPKQAPDEASDCPECAHVKARRTKWYKWINVMCVLLLGIPFLLIRKTTCPNCRKAHRVY